MSADAFRAHCGALPKQVRFLGYFLDNGAQREIEVLAAFYPAHLTRVRLTKVDLGVEHIQLQVGPRGVLVVAALRLLFADFAGVCGVASEGC